MSPNHARSNSASTLSGVAESEDRRIARGFLIVVVFVLIGKLAGALKEMALAWRYGLNEVVDGYLFVFNLVNWPIAVWLSVLTIILVPLLARIRHGEASEKQRFVGEMLGFSMLLGLLFTLIWLMLLPKLISAEWLDLPEKVQPKALEMSAGLPLLSLLGAMIAFMSILMLASSQHKNTMFEAIPALAILGALLLPDHLIGEPLLWGTLIGFVLHLFSLLIPLMRSQELVRPYFVFKTAAWRMFWGGVGITALGQLMMSIASLIDQFLAPALGAGVLASLSYAGRILGLIIGIGGVAIARATIPIFSEANTRGGSEVCELSLRWAARMFILSIILVFLVWLASENIVRILFERGAFDQDSTRSVTELLRYGLLQVPFHMAGLVLVSALASLGNYLMIAVISIVNLGIKLVACAILIPIFGVYGIVHATTLMIAFSASFALFAVVRVKQRGRRPNTLSPK